MGSASARYEVACHKRTAAFDALQAAWCSCLVTERSLVCPGCQACFCQAPAPYKSAFWSKAPRSLWDRKFAEHPSFDPMALPAQLKACLPGG